MKPPPLLVGAALLFWGWQTGSWAIAAPLAVMRSSLVGSPRNPDARSPLQPYCRTVTPNSGTHMVT